MGFARNSLGHDRCTFCVQCDKAIENAALRSACLGNGALALGQQSLGADEVLNAVFYVLSTGGQWQALPKDLPPKSTAWS